MDDRGDAVETPDALYRRYRDLLRDALLAESAGRPAVALPAFHAAAAIAPGRVVPWLGVARSAQAIGDDATARSAYRAVLEIDPSDAEAVDGLARMHAARSAMPTPVGRASLPPLPPPDWVAEDAAVRTLADRWEVAREADDAAALVEIASKLLDLGRIDAARDVVLDLVRIAPTLTVVHRLVDAVGIHRGRPPMRRWAETVRRYEAVTDDPVALDERRLAAEDAVDVVGLVEVAEAHRRRGRPYPAMEALFSAVRLRPTDPDVHAAIGRLRLERWRTERVLVDLDLLARILELDDDASGRRRIRDAAVEVLRARPHERPRVETTPA